ncbi:MAG: Siroheme synthase [Desulfonauticus sp. 38_4375]|nr:MAG: Siroheme synthase [Desulfonauticus sp. 38_4375]
MLFPLCLDLSQKKCLLVGIGEVGQRKLSTLLKFKPLQVKIIDPMRPLPKKFSHLDNIQFYARPFSPEDLEGMHLVFACTDNKELNQKIASLAKSKNILVNSATNPQDGDFSLPALWQQDSLLLAISTQGQSPALARLIKEELDKCLGREYALLAGLMGKLRPLILNHIPENKRANCFRKLAKTLLLPLKEQNWEQVKRTILKELPQIEDVVGDIIDELKL